MQPSLHLADGRIVTVLDGMVVGRLSSCSLRLDVAGVSRRHARFIVEAGVVEVEDLGSKNGTYLNGHPVTRRVVRDGDELIFGKTQATFHEGGGATKPQTTAFDDEAFDEGPEEQAAPDADELDLGDESAAEEVVEFVDEAVPVSRPAPTARPAVAPRPHRAPSTGRAGVGLNEDVSQLGGMPRLLLMLVAVLFAAGLGWLAMTLASG